MALSPANHADDAAALAALWPELVRVAPRELFTRHVGQLDAEDVVSDATMRWFEARIQYRSERQVRAWFRVLIVRIVVEAVRRPGRDVMDQGEVWSLDEPWARGGS